MAVMLHLLRRHPDSQCVAATRIEVDVARPLRGSLVVSYVVHGEISRLRLPAVTASKRSDELWRHTCFEAFFGTAAPAAYYELNFAPSTQWAAYQFSSYRAGMRVATHVRPPIIKVQSTSGCYALQASLDLDTFSDLPRDVGWRLGLAAITEDSDGRKSYWALAHPPGKADFHHSDCLAHELAGHQDA
ncbi:MAG TPA: DOMON-like domain-containing protein [Xanthobacteraceae bacterium]|jgi:hypothetical protein|nr:DOMON-like domain-containing protein [Xanthobacteraceae bacterium]